MSVGKQHSFAPARTQGISISPLLQSWYLYYESELVPNKASDLLNEVLGQKLTNRSQGQRLLEYYGEAPAVIDELVKPLKKSEMKAGIMQGTRDTPEVIYAMFDGVMLPKDGAYEETKIGRVFRASQISAPTKKDDNNEAAHRSKVFNSEYIAQRGHYLNFTQPFGKLLKAACKAYPQAQMVAITDGAEWMRAWIAEAFPNCEYILDFFHAYEHLCEFAVVAFAQDEIRSSKLSEWKKDLRHGKAPSILAEVQTYLTAKQDVVVQKAKELSTYLNNNLDRMRYDEYRQKGYLIGSGAIESAARSIVQQRCKLSGQRWCEQGSLQAALNIRSIYKSGKRKRIEKIIAADYADAA